MDVDDASDKVARKRISTACEACRVTKIRCQPSDQPGVCKKCLESKRECISRTLPRPRRPRRHALPQDNTAAAPPGPSSTFSIDFSIAAQPEVDDDFETLRDTHNQAIDMLFPAEDDDEFAHLSAPSSSANFNTPPSSSTQSHSLHDLHTKPSFNVKSAESLLQSFPCMLRYLPFITLSPDTSIAQLAATRPFVLLAILASSSGSKTLQGHSLYDEEFRKVLGLKFVVGGERSLELLQGLLIYIGWYPFHLRPKNKQALQYMRMAADLVHDLELDQEQIMPSLWSDAEPPTTEQMDGIRAYVGYCYLVTTFLVTWKRDKSIEMAHTQWTARCCDILEAQAQHENDAILANMARLSSYIWQASKAMNHKKEQSHEDSRLMLGGLKSQLSMTEASLPPSMATLIPMRLQILFIRVYLEGGTVLKLPRPLPSESHLWAALPSANTNLRNCVAKLKDLFDYVRSLDDSELTYFTVVDWGRIILGIIIAIRMSFKVVECPEYDSTWARSQIQLGDFLGYMCQQKSDLTPASKKVDILSASRIVMRVVKDKFDRRLNALQEREEAKQASMGCPMLDGSLDQYFPAWDAGFVTPATFGSTMPPDGGLEEQGVFQDLWTTMTQTWVNE